MVVAALIVISNAICNPLQVASHLDQVWIPPTAHRARHRKASRLFDLLLGAELVGVAALLLTAVGGTGGKAGL